MLLTQSAVVRKDKGADFAKIDWVKKWDRNAIILLAFPLIYLNDFLTCTKKTACIFF